MIRKILLAFSFLFLLSVQVTAQGGDPSDGVAAELQKELWCPICQGIRLDVCEQKVCDQMRDLIDTELAAGKTKEEVKAEFIDLYGPVILGEPPREGLNLLAWIVPILLLTGGLIAAVLITRRWSQKPAVAAVSEDSTVETIDSGEEDDYLARVERDLSDS